MRSSFSLTDLLPRAFDLILSSPILRWFILPFGLLGLLSFQVSNQLEPWLPQEEVDLPTLITIAQSHLASLGTMLLVLMGTGFVYTIIRGPFFLVTEHFVRSRERSEPTPLQFTQKVLFRGALITFVFETGYWLLMLLFGMCISLPILLSFLYNPNAAPVIGELGLLLLLVIAFIFFSLKEFALLYSLLAHAKFLGAAELGLRLFKKHFFTTILFNLLLVALWLLFTFLLNLAIIAIGFVDHEELRTGLAWSGVVVILGSATLLKETLRLLFFHALAATPKAPITASRETVLDKSPSEAPTA